MGRPRKTNTLLPAYVYRKRGQLRYEPPGQKSISLGTDESAALQRLYSLQGDPQGAIGRLIGEALDDHRKRKLHTAAPLADNTWKNYQTAQRILAHALADYAPETVDAHVVIDLIDSLSATPNMANRCLTVLRITFKYAVKKRIVKINPAVGTADRYDEFKRKRSLTREEYERIYLEAPARLQVIMDLCFKTGRRIRDVLGIRLDQLRNEGIYFKESKEDIELVVAWDDELRGIVDRARQLKHKVSAFTLLVNRNGKAPDYRSTQLQWQTACEAAGVEDAHIHDLRSMAITAVERQGGDSKAFSAHKSEAMHQRYLRDHSAPVVAGPILGRGEVSIFKRRGRQ